MFLTAIRRIPACDVQTYKLSEPTGNLFQQAGRIFASRETQFAYVYDVFITKVLDQFLCSSDGKEG